MGVRTFNVTYSKSGGTFLPGYHTRNRLFWNANLQGQLAPGWEFITGWQDERYAEEAFRRDLLTTDQNLNNPFTLNNTERFTARANIEPFNGLKIDLTANRMFTSNLSEYYTADIFGNLPADTARGRIQSGNFSMSYISLGTAFERIDDKVESSKTFALLKEEYRRDISQRLGAEYEEKTGIESAAIRLVIKGIWSHFPGGTDSGIPCCLWWKGSR